MTNPDFDEKLLKILFDFDHNKMSVHQCLSTIKDLIKEIIPEKKINTKHDLYTEDADIHYGYNQCRQAILDRLN